MHCPNPTAQARDQGVKDRSKWKDYAPPDALTAISEVVQSAEGVRTRAYTTKYETLCCRALLNSNHKKARLQEFVSAFTAATRGDASRNFCPAVWSAMEAVLRPRQ